MLNMISEVATLMINMLVGILLVFLTAIKHITYYDNYRFHTL